MSNIPVRELRNHTADVIQRVRDGDDVTITVNGVPVANLVPVQPTKRASMPRGEFVRTLLGRADSGLRADLTELAGETTDDLGPIR